MRPVIRCQAREAAEETEMPDTEPGGNGLRFGRLNAWRCHHDYFPK